MGQNSIRNSVADHQPGLSARNADSIRLDSWKEIASYLHRDARTVRRWERDRRLPVHRVPGGERSGVFAYVSELDRWLRASDGDPAVLVPGATSNEARSVVTVGARFEAQPEFTSELSRADELRSGFDIGHGSGSDAVSEPGESEAADSPQLQLPTLLGAAENSTASSDTGFSSLQGHLPGKEKSPDTTLPAGVIGSAMLQTQSSRWALYGMAVLLIVAIAGGSGFAFVHYRRFHQAVAVNPQPNLEAKDLYLRGRYYWNLRTEEGLNQAVDLFTQSIVNDPHYAPAYAGLADSYLLLRQYGHMPDSEAYPRALAAARQAVSLDASCPAAHRSIAFILRFWNWDMPAAEREYLRAIELDPKSSQSHHWYATALLSSGRINEALAQIDLARELEPQSISVLADRGLILSLKDPGGGAEALKQLAQSRPDFASVHAYLSRIYLDLGDYAGFLEESRIAATLTHDPAKIVDLDRAKEDLAARGPLPMLRDLASHSALLTDRGQGSAYLTARLFGLAGDTPRAIHYLQIACDRRDPGFLSMESDGAFRNARLSQQ